MKRFVFAALAGMIVLFLWGGISHSFIIAGVGFTPLPDEEKIIRTLSSSIREKGLYFFPGRSFKNRDPVTDARWEEQFRNGPVGMLIYRPTGGTPFSANLLLTQLAFNFIVALIIAWLVSLMNTGCWRKVGAVTLLGVLGCAAVSSIYWNWYAFPTGFFLAQCFDVITGFFLAGLVVVKIAGKKHPSTA